MRRFHSSMMAHGASASLRIMKTVSLEKFEMIEKKEKKKSSIHVAFLERSFKNPFMSAVF